MNRTICILSHAKDPDTIHSWMHTMQERNCRVITYSMADFWEFIFDCEDDPLLAKELSSTAFWIDSVDPEQLPEAPRMVTILRRLNPRPAVSVLVNEEDSLHMREMSDGYVLVHSHGTPIEPYFDHVIGKA